MEEEGPASINTDPPVPLAVFATLPSPARRRILPAAPLAASPVVISILPLAVPVSGFDKVSEYFGLGVFDQPRNRKSSGTPLRGSNRGTNR